MRAYDTTSLGLGTVPNETYVVDACAPRSSSARSVVAYAVAGSAAAAATTRSGQGQGRGQVAVAVLLADLATDARRELALPSGAGEAPVGARRGKRAAAAVVDDADANGDARRHEVTGVAMGADDAVVVGSCTDGRVYAWDARVGGRDASVVRVFAKSEGKATGTDDDDGTTPPPSTAKGSFADVDLGLNGTLVAGAFAAEENSAVVLWDARMEKTELGVFGEAHSQDVTRVAFADPTSAMLASGSEDGLVCVFDLAKPGEDEALLATMNTGSSVAKLGFFGASLSGVYALTGTETLSVFDVPTAKTVVAYENDLMRGTGLRQTLKVDYFVDCLFRPADEKLVLLGGSLDGRLEAFEVKTDGFSSLGVFSADAAKGEGHTDVVRCADWIDGGDDVGWIVVTGGEDGRAVVWSSSS